MKTRRGFMDKVDFDHELGEALGGNRIYPSVEDLIQHEPCVDQCGIVEVEVSLVRVVKDADYSDAEPISKKGAV